MRILLTIFIALCSFTGVMAQQLPEFIISDTTVHVCDGILYDSGGIGAPSGINEDFTFIIETSGVIQLEFTQEFCVETNVDFIYIYDGIGVGAPLIATLTGVNIALPAPITSSSGAITIQFVADQSVGYCGFSIVWDTIAGEPIPPEIAVNTMPACGSNIVQVDFSYPIGCTWIDPGNMTFFGGEAFDVIDLNINCDSANFAELVLDHPIDYNCNYNIFMSMEIKDYCDSTWVFELLTDFTYEGCPVQGSILASADSICSGECLQIEALVQGCFEYTFSWNNGLPPTPGPFTICPTNSTTYTVEITETQTGNIATESFTIGMLSSQILQNDTSICQSFPAFYLNATPPGGLWYGDGILEQETGLFEPDNAQIGPNVIYYVVSEFCTDSIIITINPIDAGGIYAACPGSPPFQLTGTPTGGTWSGPNTTPSGLFDPVAIGTYLVYYQFGSCMDSVEVNVNNITGNFELGNICQSEWIATLDFSPLGGTWSGVGIADTLLGIYDPGDMLPGPGVFVYEIFGCSQLYNYNLIPIEAYGGNMNSCPLELPYIPYPDFTPPGGAWGGLGIIDANSGLYDPSLVPNSSWTSLIYYAPNGCSDTIFMYNQITDIYLDSLFFCVNDDAINLTEIGSTPWAGQWIGAGVSFSGGNDWYFSPDIAGSGTFTLTFENNTCSDQLIVVVYPDQLNLPLLSVCSDQAPFLLLDNLPVGDLWTGNGIMNAQSGLFDPQLAEFGENTILWSTGTGCMDTISVEVEEFFQAQLSGLNEFYCFQDSSIWADIFPPGALLIGGESDSTFNPSLAENGYNNLLLVYDSGLCTSSDSMQVYVYPAIESTLSTNDEIICSGTATNLQVIASGGLPDVLLQYEWSNNLFPVSVNTVYPETTTTYYVITYDGCSDTVTDSVVVQVLPPITVNVETSDTLCFGDLGWANAVVNQVGTFSFNWSTTPTTTNEIVNATAGSTLGLQVTDDVEGCVFDTTVVIPNYTAIAAYFSYTPNDACIAYDANPISIIDLSEFGLSGNWDFGNGETQDYIAGNNPTVDYSQAGTYTIILAIENEGSCTDTAYRDICILSPTPIFIPDIFSPNNDLVNDVLFVRGNGIVDMEFQVFDRWGQLVFESKSPDKGWDGNHNGKPAPSGVYVYQLQAELNNGARTSMKGDVTLIR